MEAASQAGWIAFELMTRAWLIEILLDLGELDAARGLLTPTADGEIPDKLMLNFLLHARGRAKLAAGELEAGLADLAELRQREAALGWRNPPGSRTAVATSLLAVDIIGFGAKGSSRRLTGRYRFKSPTPAALLLSTPSERRPVPGRSRKQERQPRRRRRVLRRRMRERPAPVDGGVGGNHRG